ncbi:hypothetical protein PYCCODRAFT_1438282 [Trametes coccinea BRFM310]|uniref:Pentacotripeptide-repeat region of PRORP domain-containing protein n=1 Tax=Trametes coccinea (strain BRFM310) TaxID=1353009 RepID=A0A1Y2IHW8_TRAC3|nr:hypothetical protein PYCCODRAFT_1438282 [Trametes coccinea BRFM310]
MLLRTTSHGIPQAITLDFLIPRAVLHHNLSGIICKPSRALSTSHGASAPSGPAQPSTSSAPLTPGAVLARLHRDVGAFDEQSLATMTTAQVNAFNSAIPTLRHALAKRDTPSVAATWATLKARKLLPFFGIHHYGMCSNGVVRYVRGLGPQQELNKDDESLLRDMAVVSAAGGATDGLKALMFRAIKNKQPDAALALYEEYLQHLRQKGPLPGEVPENAEADAADDGVYPEDTPSALLSPVRDEILLMAIAAYAQKKSFADALQAYRQAGTRIAPSTIEEFMYSDRDFTMYREVADWARQLDTAALLSRPPSLMKHLINLTRDRADKSLERLYASALAGAREPDPWLAITPAQLGGTRIVALPDFFWVSFLRAFLSVRRPQLTVQLWDDMLALGVQPDVAAWNALLDGYVEMRSLDAVLKTWELMREQRIKPDALSYRALISAHFTAGKIEEALKLFHGFEQDYVKRGVPPEDSAVLAAYNSTLHNLLFADHEAEALAVKKRMEERGPKPDIVTYNTFMRYYGRKGKLKEMAHILQQLEPAGVKADAYTFSTLLAALLKVRADAGQIVLNFMKKQGVVPDTTALTAMINQQLQERTPQSFSAAMDMLSRMERGEFGNAKPNAITYTAVLTAINHGNWLERSVVEEYSRRIWETMQSRDIQPNRATYNVLIRASLENREPEGLENAMRYYRDMVRNRVHIGSDTWYILLQGLKKRKEYELAREVVQDMRDFKTNRISGSR